MPAVSADWLRYLGKVAILKKHHDKPHRYATAATVNITEAELAACLKKQGEMPTVAHHKLQELVEAGVVTSVITQNIDGLESCAGMRLNSVFAIHGGVSTSTNWA